MWDNEFSLKEDSCAFMTDHRSVLWGLRGRCPKCGEGRLYASYLKVVDQCPACNEPLGHIRADDGPPFFAMFIAMILTALAGVGIHAFMPMGVWALVTVLCVFALVLCIVLLPPIKGIMVGIMWAHGLTGDDEQ